MTGERRGKSLAAAQSDLIGVTSRIGSAEIEDVLVCRQALKATRYVRTTTEQQLGYKLPFIRLHYCATARENLNFLVCTEWRGGARRGLARRRWWYVRAPRVVACVF